MGVHFDDTGSTARSSRSTLPTTEDTSRSHGSSSVISGTQAELDSQKTALSSESRTDWPRTIDTNTLSKAWQPPPDSSNSDRYGSTTSHARTFQPASRTIGHSTSGQTSRDSTTRRSGRSTPTTRRSSPRPNIGHKVQSPPRSMTTAQTDESQVTNTTQTGAPTETSNNTSKSESKTGLGRWLMSTGWGASKATAGAFGAMGHSLAASALSGLGYEYTSQDSQTETEKAKRIGAFPSEDSATTGVSISPADSTAVSGTAITNTTGTEATGTAATGQNVSERRRRLEKQRTGTNVTGTTAATARTLKGLKRAAFKAIVLRDDTRLRSLMSRMSPATDTGATSVDTRRHGMFFDADTLASLSGVNDQTTCTGVPVTRKSWFHRRKDHETTGATEASSYAPTASSVASTDGTGTTGRSRNPFRRGSSRKPVAQSSLELMKTANAAQPTDPEQPWYQSYWTGQRTAEPTSPTTATAVSIAPQRSLFSRSSYRSAPRYTEASIVPTATADTAVSQNDGSTALSMAGTVLSTGVGLTWGIGQASVSALWAGGQSVYDYYTKHSPPDPKTAVALKKGGLKSTLKSTSPGHSVKSTNPGHSVMQSEGPDTSQAPRKRVGFA